MVLNRVMQGVWPAVVLFLSACTSVTVDQYHAYETTPAMEGGRVVVLGRRHASDHETEPDLVDCLGKVLSQSEQLEIIPEQQFLDDMYPWFEPRIAPMKVRDMNRLLRRKPVAKKIESYNIRYLIWVDGSTETTESRGSVGCTIGAGGAGCFGFGSWDKESDYEATIWDYQNMRNLGNVSADAEGTSYMPAVIIPIPMIAQVQNQACRAMGDQLRQFLQSDETPN